MTTRVRRRLLAGALILAGCGLVPNDPAPADGPQLVGECEAPLAFEGEATIAGLGLADAIPNVPADDATRQGTIQITRDAVRWEEFAPPKVPPAVAAGQLLCVTWDDGSGFMTLLHGPFSGEVNDQDGGTETSGLSATLFFIAVAVLVVAAASWLAFGRGVRSSEG